MKHQRNLIIVIITLLAFFNSCQKKTFKTHDEIGSNLEINSLEKLVTGEDIEDNNVNTQIISLTKILKNRLDEKSFNLNLKKKNIRAKEFLAEKDAELQTVVYDNNKYDLAYTVYNFENCDSNLTPIIAIGSSIEHNGQQDLIPAWEKDDGNRWTFILLSEKAANETKNPVLILNPIEEKIADESLAVSKEMPKKPMTPDKRLGNSKAAGLTYKIKIDKEKINYKYENDGNAEFYVSWIIDAFGFGYSYEYERKKVCNIDIKGWNSELGDLLGHDFWFYWKEKAGTTTSYKHYAFNSDYKTRIIGATYEHDWYASLKFVSVSGHQVPIRAKYNHEYYQRIDFDIPAFEGNSVSVVSKSINEKGKLELTSVL
jgi:hypothetical protein